jgi:hypothetical protein
MGVFRSAKRFLFGRTETKPTLDPYQQDIQKYLYYLLATGQSPLLEGATKGIAEEYEGLMGQTARQFAGEEERLGSMAGALGLQTKAPGRYYAQLGQLGAARQQAFAGLGVAEAQARRQAVQQAIANALAFISPQTMAYIRQKGFLDYLPDLVGAYAALKGGR